MERGRFEFTDVVSGSFGIVSVRDLGPGVELILATDDQSIAMVLPRDVAADIGRSLLSPPPLQVSISDIVDARYELEQRAPADVMDLDERGELDDDALDDGLWMALLGSGVSPGDAPFVPRRRPGVLRHATRGMGDRKRRLPAGHRQRL